MFMRARLAGVRWSDPRCRGGRAAFGAGGGGVVVALAGHCAAGVGPGRGGVVVAVARARDAEVPSGGGVTDTPYTVKNVCVL